MKPGGWITMKMKLKYAGMTILLFVLGTVAAWSQITTGKVQGRITNGDKPVPNANVTLVNPDNGRSYKIKADANGRFESIGIPHGTYDEEVSDASGEKLAKVKVQVAGQSGDVDDLSVDVAQRSGTGLSKEEYDKKKAEHDKGVQENTLIAQLNPAMQSKNWAAAEPILQQLTTMNPNRWDYQRALGDTQAGLEKYDDAIAAYEKAIPLAEEAAKGGSADKKEDPAKAKAAVAQMLNSEGSVYLKLKKNDKAIEAYTKAAAADPNPALAYYNICATQYNAGNAEAGLPACDKAIAADPNRADSYFIKGSLLMGQSTQGKDNKLDAPAGTAEAFNKYLQLAPEGPHAADAKQMLAAIGAKIDTTYHDPNAKKKK